ncbi:MAG: bifunctional methylenetetrahydrofolate dehydrogenase/methenyltetrahydrofolate cyclohydrolase, partial [Rhodoblastus sp.]|nr:bifunctional methylenetetrahydrofolate dehydrogenase/methenyltetrahydrofolate cyclohydrolase [Rhodoblastus sp.]
MSDFLRPSAKKALIIDGKIAAAGVVEETRAKTQALLARGVRPGLAVVLVGDDPASGVYVRSKSRMAESLGFHSVQHNLPADVAQADLNALVEKLNADPAIHGILVQL